MGFFACALGGEDGRTLLLCAAPDFLEHNRRDAREAVLLTSHGRGSRSMIALEKAQALITAGIEEAGRQDLKLAFAVVDAAGHLVASRPHGRRAVDRAGRGAGQGLDGRRLRPAQRGPGGQDEGAPRLLGLDLGGHGRPVHAADRRAAGLGRDPARSSARWAPAAAPASRTRTSSAWSSGAPSEFSKAELARITPVDPSTRRRTTARPRLRGGCSRPCGSRAARPRRRGRRRASPVRRRASTMTSACGGRDDRSSRPWKRMTGRARAGRRSGCGERSRYESASGYGPISPSR